MARSQTNNDDYLDVTVELDAPLDTRITLVPECECEAEVTDWAIRVYPRKTQPGEFVAMFDLTWTVVDEKIKQLTELAEPRGRQTIFLETEKGWNGKGPPPLERGRNKNVYLARLLEGFGMNKKGQKFKWSSFMHERKYVRFELPDDPELQNVSNVVAVGKDRNSVMKPSDRKKASTSAAA